MKVDLVITCYERPDLWDKVAWGILQNQAHINQVICVHDGPWTWTPTLDLPLTLLSHPKDGFGVAASHNLGLEAATTDYVARIDDDIVLAPDALANNLSQARPQNLIFGNIHQLAPDSDLANPTFTRYDQISPLIKMHPYHIARGGWFIVDRAADRQIGGWNADFTSYGFQDYEYTLRWMIAFKPSSVTLAPGAAWHLGTMKTHYTLPKDHPQQHRVTELYHQLMWRWLS